MSLYERFFIAQHVSNVITFILRSWRLYVGVLEHVVLQLAFGYHPTPAEPHQYTSTQRNRTIHLHTVASS